jgi:hypothetical protein
MSQLFYLVRSVEEVEFRTDLADEEAKAKASFLQKYRSVIVPPSGRQTNGSYKVTAYVIREQALEQHSITVSEKGGIKTDVTILEQDLPLVYGL